MNILENIKAKKITIKISPQLLLLLVISVAIDVAVLLAEKLATQNCGQIIGKELSFYQQLLCHPWTWCSFALTAVQLVVWRDVLKYVQLTFACCVSSAAYPLTTLAAMVFLKGNVQTIEWLGIALVTFGIVLASTGKNAEHYNTSNNTSAPNAA